MILRNIFYSPEDRKHRETQSMNYVVLVFFYIYIYIYIYIYYIYILLLLLLSLLLLLCIHENSWKQCALPNYYHNGSVVTHALGHTMYT